MTSKVAVNSLSLLKIEKGWVKWAYFGKIKTKDRNVFPHFDEITENID